MRKGLIIGFFISTIILSGCADGGSVSTISFKMLYPVINNVFGIQPDEEFAFEIDGVSGMSFYLGQSEDALELVQPEVEMTTEVATLNLINLGLLPGTQYYYQVAFQDGTGNSSKTQILTFSTEFNKEEKDEAIEAGVEKFMDEEYVEVTTFSSETNTGTITIKDKTGKTAGDLWGVINDFLIKDEEKAFPVVLEDVYSGLNGTYQYAESRLNPDLTYDIDIKEFDDKLDSGEFVKDPLSLLYKFIDSGARGVKLDNTDTRYVTLSLILQGDQYEFVFDLGD